MSPSKNSNRVSFGPPTVEQIKNASESKQISKTDTDNQNQNQRLLDNTGVKKNLMAQIKDSPGKDAYNSSFEVAI